MSEKKVYEVYDQQAEIDMLSAEVKRLHAIIEGLECDGFCKRWNAKYPDNKQYCQACRAKQAVKQNKGG
jgi:uncharacterized protein (DUF2236 family)